MRKLKVSDKALNIQLNFISAKKDYEIIRKRYEEQLQNLHTKFWEQLEEDYPEIAEDNSYWEVTPDFRYVCTDDK